jgi:hypothetical protein
MVLKHLLQKKIQPFEFLYKKLIIFMVIYLSQVIGFKDHVSHGKNLKYIIFSIEYQIHRS